MADPLAMSFDQYQRYATTARVIDTLRMPGETFRILELGANVNRRMEQVLPADDTTYLDKDLPSDLVDGRRFVRGDATALDFADNSFDFVVALDVFEHIPRERRHTFLAEAFRVARRAVVIAAPFDTEGVREAESAANRLHRDMYGAPYRWLREHAEYGLPDLPETRALLGKIAPHVHVFAHGSLSLWVPLIKVHFVASMLRSPRHGIGWIDRLYNARLFENDIDPPCYRHFIVATSNPAYKARIEQATLIGRTEPDELARSLALDIARTVEEIGQGLATPRTQIRKLRSSLWWRLGQLRRALGGLFGARHRRPDALKRSK